MSTHRISVLLILILHYVLLSQASDNSNARIIDGEVSDNGQFPYAVGFFYVKDGTTGFCSGSLLNNQWILTAAHCIIDATEFTVHLGTNNLEQAGSSGLVVNSTEYIAHPSYNPSNLANDIGLILLDAPIEFTDKIQPIELSTRTLVGSEDVTAVGWGAISDAGPSPSNILYHVSVTTLTNTECYRILPSPVIRGSVVCVIGDGVQGTCRGDAGGPLIQVDSNDKDVQVGVSIFHVGSCEDIYPSGFIRSADYIDWINDAISATGEDGSSSAACFVLFLPLIIIASFVQLI